MFLKTLTKEMLISYIKTMFIKVYQGTKNPEAGPFTCHLCTQLSLVTQRIFVKELFLLSKERCPLNVQITNISEYT